jgi:hypothetical protein
MQSLYDTRATCWQIHTGFITFHCCQWLFEAYGVTYLNEQFNDFNIGNTANIRNFNFAQEVMFIL